VFEINLPFVLCEHSIDLLQCVQKWLSWL